METSAAALLICAAFLAAGRWMGSAAIIGLFGSLAFGATAIATLHALGGASPPIYTVFAVLLLLIALARRTILTDLTAVFRGGMAPWLALGLLIYVIAGAYIFPRLFAGQTSVFVANRLFGVQEVPLSPSNGNLTQTGYFAVGVLAFIALRMQLARPGQYLVVERALFTWAILSATLGLLDLGGKISGAGDILAPIRTATYAMLTSADNAISGFYRISGGHSEASGFAFATLPCLAFSFTYWHLTGSAFAFWLASTLLALLILSTSTTGYVGLAIIALPLAASLARAALTNRLRRQDLMLCGIAAACLTLALAVHLLNPKTLEPFGELLDSMVFNKGSSSSAEERGLWNAKSMASLSDTNGLGIGMGSSRASSWIIAVFSQFGILGALLQAALVAILLRGAGHVRGRLGQRTYALARSARAAALASLVAASISGSGADPGLIFFMALALVLAVRSHAAGFA